VVVTSAAVVGAWGYFLWQGVKDPLGGINSMWPLFGISNQLLAAVALCVATTILIKMGRARYAFVSLAPLIVLVAVTFGAAWEKVLNPKPQIGFLAHARQLATGNSTGQTSQLIFNDRLDAAITTVLVSLVALVVLQSVIEWWRVLSGSKTPVVREAPFVLSDFAEERG
jgi:carbon starvation protein